MLEELEKLGYEPVCIAGGTMRKAVKADARKRADERAQRYKDILKGRYRIEQVFGVVKEICGSYLSVRSEKIARLMMLCMFVLWNMGRLQGLICGYIFLFYFSRVAVFSWDF